MHLKKKNSQLLAIILVICVAIFINTNNSAARDIRNLDEFQEEIEKIQKYLFNHCNGAYQGQKYAKHIADTTASKDINMCIQKEIVKFDICNGLDENILSPYHCKESVEFGVDRVSKAIISNLKKTIEDNYETLLRKYEDSAIKIIKSHYLENFSKEEDFPPFGVALEKFFSKTSWKTDTKYGEWVVTFNGSATWGENGARFTWTFEVSPSFADYKISGYSFRYSLKINGNAVSTKQLNNVLGAVYLN